jgi:hypothetical protein
MIRRTKTFGLTFVAVAAMNMTAIGNAQASEAHITTAQKANITGENTNQHIFQVTAPENAQTQCSQALFEGTVQGGQLQITAQHLTVTGTYTNDCTAFGLNMTVDMNGCKYTITGTGQPALTALVDITGCTIGKGIEITVAGCTKTILPQSGLSHITFTNEGSGSTEDVLAHATIQGITYEMHGALCPGAQTVLTHNGDYTGTTTVKAFQDVGTSQATHNGHTYTKHLCGTQVGLFAT